MAFGPREELGQMTILPLQPGVHECDDQKGQRDVLSSLTSNSSKYFEMPARESMPPSLSTRVHDTLPRIIRPMVPPGELTFPSSPAFIGHWRAGGDCRRGDCRRGGLPQLISKSMYNWQMRRRKQFPLQAAASKKRSRARAS